MLVFGDRHALSNDKRIDKILLEIIKDCGTDLKYIVDLGDGINGDALSSYDKTHAELSGLQKELNDDYDFRSQINALSPRSKKILLTCNHFSARLMRAKTVALWAEDLEALEQSNLMKLNELGWLLRDEYIVGHHTRQIMFIHGDGSETISSTKNVTNPARNLMKENGVSIVRGHSHTTGFEIHNRFGQYQYAIQIGTLHDMRKSPKYIKHGKVFSNWSTSAGMFYVRMDGKQFFFVPIVFENGRTVFEGKIYG